MFGYFGYSVGRIRSGRGAGARRAGVRLSLASCLALALIIVSLFAEVGGAPAALASGAGRSIIATRADAVAQAVQLDGPAVVRILSVVNASLICHGCGVDSAGKVIDIVSPQTGAFTYESSGSGAFITPTGDVLTADHVIDHSANNPEDVAFIEQAAAQDISQQTGGKTTAADVTAYFQAHPSQVQIQTQVPFQKAYLSTDYTGQLASVSQVLALPITGVAASSPVLAQDTAIVHTQLQGIPDVPYLTVAPPNSVNVGDTVTAIAFPADADNALGNADFTALLTPAQSDPNTISSLLGPSVNTGQVTSQKTRSDGSVIYETNGIGSQGSSGGPVIDNQGQIIGFVDATPSTGTDRLTFLIASDEILTYTKRAGDANPAAGHFMTLWRQALGAYNGTASCRYHTAATDFTTLQSDYPKFGAVKTLAASAQQKRATETCASTSGVGSLVALVGGIIAALVIVALLVGGLLFFLRRRRAAPQPQPVVAGPTGAYGPPFVAASGPYSPTPYGAYTAAPGAQPSVGATPPQPTPAGAPVGGYQAPQPPYSGPQATGQALQPPLYAGPYQGQPGQPGQPGQAPYPAPVAQPPYPAPYGMPGAAQPGQAPQAPMQPGQPPTYRAPYTPPDQRPFNALQAIPPSGAQPAQPGQPPAQPYAGQYAAPYPPAQPGQPAAPLAPYQAAPVAPQAPQAPQSPFGALGVARSAPQQVANLQPAPPAPPAQSPQPGAQGGDMLGGAGVAPSEARTILKSELRYCPNGHRVTDVTATTCPICGAPVAPLG